jgi:RimJ/RimL family protein N-acetyltransferase
VSWVAPTTLTGRHVRLEPLALEHVPALLDAGGDDEVWRWLPWERPVDEAAMAALVLELGEQTANGWGVPFAQVELASGRAVGWTNYLDIQPQHRTLEVGGTWLGRPWWRSAVNTEAKLLLLRHAFDDLAANRVALKTDIRNERSQAAIARLGAVREGVLRAHYVRRDGSLRDTVLFSVTAAEWPAVRAHLQERLTR